MAIRGEIAYHDYEGIAVDLDERERMIADLGDKSAMILRNHGTLALGENVGEAFIKLYFLERACEAQVKALSAGAQNLNNPPQGSPEAHRRAGQGRPEDGRELPRLAGAAAQGLPARSELRDLIAFHFGSFYLPGRKKSLPITFLYWKVMDWPWKLETSCRRLMQSATRNFNGTGGGLSAVAARAVWFADGRPRCEPGLRITIRFAILQSRCGRDPDHHSFGSQADGDVHQRLSARQNPTCRLRHPGH